MAMSGKETLEFLVNESPSLILLDVMMPEMSGYEVCRLIKDQEHLKNIPIIFLTAKNETDDIVKGFEAGGVDFVTKPFHAAELLARVKTHLELKHSREEIIRLKGILPICANCHRIRDDKGYWERVELYFSHHSDLEFSHSICPDCIRELYPDLADELPDMSNFKNL